MAVILTVGFGVSWRHPSGNDEQEVGYIYVEFIEATQDEDIFFEDSNKLLPWKSMSTDEIDQSDKRPVTEPRGNAVQ